MAIRDNVDNGNTYYFSINGNGNLCEKSKEPKEGFVGHNNPLTGEFAGYWKEYYNGISGYINYIGIKTRPGANNMNIQYFVIALKDWKLGENYCVSFPLFTQKGGIHRYVKSFVKYYRNIDFSKEIILNSFKKKPTDQFSPQNLVFAYPSNDGGKDTMVDMFYKSGQNGWIEPTKVNVFGTEKNDYTQQDQFVYNELVNYVNDFNVRIVPIRQNLQQMYGGSSSQNNQQQNIYNQNTVAQQQYQQPQQQVISQQAGYVPQNTSQQPAQAKPQGNAFSSNTGFQQPQGYNNGFQQVQQDQQPNMYNNAPVPEFPEPIDDLPF